MINGNSTKIKNFLGDFTTETIVNNFIETTCGIQVIDCTVTYINPPLATGETVAYLLIYKIN